MSDEENFIKKLERNMWERDNKERAKLGRDLIPLPESLMEESELDIALENQHKEEREKAKYGYPKNTVFNRKQKFDSDFKLIDYEDIEEEDDEDSDDYEEDED